MMLPSRTFDSPGGWPLIVIEAIARPGHQPPELTWKTAGRRTNKTLNGLIPEATGEHSRNQRCAFDHRALPHGILQTKDNMVKSVPHWDRALIVTQDDAA